MNDSYMIGATTYPPDWFFEAVENDDIVLLSLDGEMPPEAAKVLIGATYLHVSLGQSIAYRDGEYTILPGTALS